MFGLFKRDPKKDLEKRIAAKLKEARDVQRTEGVRASGKILQEVEELRAELERVQAAG